MGRRLSQEEAIGLLVISVGMVIVVCLMQGRDAWPRSVPGILFGLSLIAFGWSMRSRGQRQKRRQRSESD